MMNVSYRMKTCRAPRRPDDPLARLDQGTASCRSSPRISSREDELGHLAGGATSPPTCTGGTPRRACPLDRPQPRVAPSHHIPAQNMHKASSTSGLYSLHHAFSQPSWQQKNSCDTRPHTRCTSRRRSRRHRKSDCRPSNRSTKVHRNLRSNERLRQEICHSSPHRTRKSIPRRHRFQSRRESCKRTPCRRLCRNRNRRKRPIDHHDYPRRTRHTRKSHTRGTHVPSESATQSGQNTSAQFSQIFM